MSKQSGVFFQNFQASLEWAYFKVNQTGLTWRMKYQFVLETGN